MTRRRNHHLIAGYPSAPATQKLVRVSLETYQILRLLQVERPPVPKGFGWGRMPLSTLLGEAVALLRAQDLAARPVPEKRYRTR